MFKRAIVRLPAFNFADGLTTADLGSPDYTKVCEQHEAYRDALRQCGLMLTHLDPDARYPDSTFVEDTAVLTERCAIMTRPGAPSRAGEVDGMRSALAHFFPILESIEPPGTVDGGDICEADGHFFIGVSQRTNAEGARQLAGRLAKAGYPSSQVDVRGIQSILHLKSGVSYLGDRRLVVIDALAEHEAFRNYELIRVQPGEEYAANCVRVNDYAIIAAGYPRLQAALEGLNYRVIPLDMSEFQKMDGGLSCLSLRF